MSIWWILVIAAGAYGWKALGVFVLSRVELEGALAGLAAHLPAALFAGLIVQQAFAAGGSGIVGTRVAGVAAGALLAWRRAALLAVIAGAAAVTAVARLVTG